MSIFAYFLVGARGPTVFLVGTGVRMVATKIMRGRPNPRCWAFFDRLRAARLKAGLTREALSKAAGVGPAVASRFELRKGFPRLQTLEALSVALSVAPPWLAFGFEGPWDNSARVSSSGLAQRLRETRSALELSLREVERRTRQLAHEERVGLSEGAVRRIERGKLPTLDTLEALAVALGVSPSWLAWGVGDRELPQRGSRSVVADHPTHSLMQQ